MKKLFLILLLCITAYFSNAQLVLRINKYLVDSAVGGISYLWFDTSYNPTGQGHWKNIGSGSGGGGSIILAGQNYLSLAGGTLTANAVNLSGTNVTGTLAAARFPALTGVVQNSAGSLTTSFVAGSIVNADVNASAAIAYSKLNLTGAILNADLAGSIAYSKLSLTGAILNADLAGSIAQSKITNLVSDLAAKQGTITLTTTGSSGAATLIGNTLNIPQYSGGGSGSDKFGKVGNDVTAAENRNFDANNFQVNIDSVASLRLSTKTVSGSRHRIEMSPDSLNFYGSTIRLKNTPNKISSSTDSVLIRDDNGKIFTTPAMTYNNVGDPTGHFAVYQDANTITNLNDSLIATQDALIDTAAAIRADFPEGGGVGSWDGTGDYPYSTSNMWINRLLGVSQFWYISNEGDTVLVTNAVTSRDTFATAASTYFTEEFVGTNGDDIQGTTTTTGGFTWTASGGNTGQQFFDGAGNVHGNSTGVQSKDFINIGHTEVDLRATVYAIQVTTPNPYMMLAYTDDNNFIQVGIHNGYVAQTVAGVYTELYVGSGTSVNGDIMRARLSGTTLQVYRGVTLLTTQSVSGSLTGGKVGLYFYQDNASKVSYMEGMAP